MQFVAHSFGDEIDPVQAKEFEDETVSEQQQNQNPSATMASGTYCLPSFLPSFLSFFFFFKLVFLLLFFFFLQTWQQ